MTIWCVHITCWIPKATNTHSEYVILIALPLYLWLHDRASVLRYTYIACLGLFSEGPRPVLGSNQLRIQCTSKAFFPGVMRSALKPATHIHPVRRLEMPGAIPPVHISRKNKKIYSGWNLNFPSTKYLRLKFRSNVQYFYFKYGTFRTKILLTDWSFWSFSCFFSLPEGKYRDSASEYAKTASSDIPPVHYFQLILQFDATRLLTMWFSSRLGFVICFLPPQAVCRYRVMISEQKLRTLYNLRALFSRRES
jgi:hypothetical protein